MATAALYSAVFSSAFDKKIDLLDDAIKVALVSSAYTPNLDTHDFLRGRVVV